MDVATPTPVEAAVESLKAARKTLETEVAQVLADLDLPTTDDPAEILKLFAGVDGLVKVAEKLTKRAKDERQGLNDRTLQALQKLGLRNAPVQGGPTIYQARELWAGVEASGDEVTDEDRNEAIEALKSAGLDEYVAEGFNVQQLSAFFRERERELEEQIREREGLPADEPVVVDLDELFAGELAPLRGKIKLSEKVTAKAKTS